MPRLLLHTCCVLCSCHVLEKLKTEFALTAYFYNPNIEPREEYEKRRDTVKEWCDKAGVLFVEGEYDPPPLQTPQLAAENKMVRMLRSFSEGEMLATEDERVFIAGDTSPVYCKGVHNAGWRRAVKGYEKEPEGGARCTVCFAFRLWQTAKFAKENNFDFFATTLTMGRNKRAELINPLAQKIAGEWGIKFYPADWKKGGGQESARQIAQKDGLYRQNYCGCNYSMG